MRPHPISFGMSTGIIYANARNGLIWCNNNNVQYCGVSYFMSSYANGSVKYFDRSAMPIDAVYRLLNGQNITLVDCSRYKRVPSAFSKGLASWVYAFNFAMGLAKESFKLDKKGNPIEDVVPWSSETIRKFGWFSKEATHVRKIVRKLYTLTQKPVRVALRICLPNDEVDWTLGPLPTRNEAPATNYIYAVVPTLPGECSWDDIENGRI